ncbi:MAG: SUMF1/EgtB/PvdO family nonheme iron enzyme [Treponema sp.]|nr:SUMF1/EgtB/PvdO family nonheme iron enzyme [Treponema sp.]
MTKDEISAKIKTLLSYLNQNLYGKEEAVRLALLSVVANESIFFMGPPGTAKSMISRRIAAAFSDFYKKGEDGKLKFTTEDGCYFEYLMNEFSTPDEICGPIDLSALNEKPSRYERQTKGYLPSANVAFLDEIWKSGPAILNTLLTIINEKKFHNGSKVEDVPLVSLAAASNELPEKNRGLEALWDRFVLRVFVNPVEKENDFFKVVDDGNKDFAPTAEQAKSLLKIDDMASWQAEINKVTLSDEAKEVISAIRKELALLNKDENHKDGEAYYVSDRRWKKIVHILKTSAFLNGRDAVDLMDCSLIEYAIWNTDKQHDEVDSIVEKILKQNGINASTAIDDINNQIADFDEYINEQFYVGSGKQQKKDPKVFETKDLLDLRTQKAAEEYRTISNSISEEIKKLDNFEKEQSEPFKANLFAEQKYCDVLISAIKSAREELENANINLEKVRARYSDENNKLTQFVQEERRSVTSKKAPTGKTSTVKTSVDMVDVDGGTFEREGWDITVSSFEIGKYPVTQKLYQSIMGENPSECKGENRPVEQVSWYDAVKFCNKLSKKDGLTSCYSGSGESIRCNFRANGYRLPTEAEWEFAARGGNNSKGYKYSGSDDLDEVGWYNYNSEKQTNDVGQKEPNELGIYDMSGNVWEWCNDWYGNYPSRNETDPFGALSGYSRVVRGGSWYDNGDSCAVSIWYYNNNPGSSNSVLGFRVVRSSSKK